MTTMTTTHAVEMDYSEADALDSAAYAWFCSCGDRGDWEHVDYRGDSAAYARARASARDHSNVSLGGPDDDTMPCGCQSGSCYCDDDGRDCDGYPL